MSLISSASAWTNDEITPKKRIPSMRKTVKKMPTHMNQIGEPDEYISQEPTSYPEMQISTPESNEQDQELRNNRVNQLINQLTSDNDGGKLADFQPMTHPILTKRTDMDEDPNIQGRPSDSTLPAQLGPLQIAPPQIRRSSENMNYSASQPNLGNFYSNYKTSYEPSQNQTVANYYSNLGLGKGTVDDKIMEKINYMIHLLEQQHNEKTSNITEEFILYTFLGVFIIFVVDSFARVGKYIR
jgi:hypothetical protein